MDEFYTQLTAIKNYLVTISPELKLVFTQVDASGFQLHTVIKSPYVALVGAIIGQKITYTKARSLRGLLYAQLGTSFTPHNVLNSDLNFLDGRVKTIIQTVTHHILFHHLTLDTEAEIRSLEVIPGIGPWTVETTLLTCLKNWDVFPLQDKFLQARMRRIYGLGDMMSHSLKWAPYRSVVTWYLWRWF
jgi:DNA-3-methyladenine glycosylase II